MYGVSGFVTTTEIVLDPTRKADANEICHEARLVEAIPVWVLELTRMPFTVIDKALSPAVAIVSVAFAGIALRLNA